MTPSQFSDQWKRSPITRYRLSSPLAEGLSAAAASALREYGLPQTAEPWLSFAEYVRIDSHTSSELDKRGFYPIGSLANGSFICIEKKSGRAVIFDPNDPDEDWVLNSSLEALYESVFLYDAFIEEVNRRNPAFSSDFKIPDGMLSELTRSLTACDPDEIIMSAF